MSSTPLSGMNAVVTGSSRNIGKAIALDLAAKGANVAVNARNNIEEAEEVAKEIRDRFEVQALAAKADCSSPDEVEALGDEVRASFDKVDILVNNVGIAPMVPFEHQTIDDWETTIRVSLSSAYYVTKQFAPGMLEREWGRIINIGGIAGMRGTWGKSANAAAKNGLIGLTRANAREFAPHGVTVNHVGPGQIDTTDRVRYYKDMREEVRPGWREGLVETIPMERNGTVEEVAYAVGFLAQREASYITGQTLLVNGGMFFV